MNYKYKKTPSALCDKKEYESIKNLYESGKLIQATSEAIKYIEKYPEDMYGHFLCGKLFYRCKRYEDAKKEFEIVYQADGKNKYSGLVYLAQTEAMLENVELAKTYYKKAIEESPYFEHHAIVNLAQLERKTGNYEAAIQLIETKAPNTKEINILLEKVQSLTLLNRIDESWELLTEMDPNDDIGLIDIYLEKANVSKIKEDYDAAKYYLELAKQSGAKNSLYYISLFELAKINIKKGLYDETIANCEELIEANHLFDNDVYLALGMSCQKSKQYQQAIKAFRHALLEKDKLAYTTANYYLATLEYCSGNEQQAEEYLKESINADSSFNLTKYVKLLNILLRQERYEEAQEILNEAVKKDENAIMERELYIASLLIDTGLNKIITPTRRNNYIAEQIIGHKDEQTLEHIKRNHNLDQKKKSSFNPNIDIEKLYEEIKLSLSPEYIASKGVLDDYEMDYPNVGISNGEISNKLTVMTLPGTKKIVTMHPSHNDDLPRKIDILKEAEKQKTKQNDRIAKFYQKYGKSAPKTN